VALTVNSTDFNNSYNDYSVNFKNTAASPPVSNISVQKAFELSRFTPAHLIRFSTQLNSTEKEQYNTIVRLLATAKPEELRTLPEDTISMPKKLDALLKNGKLLDKNSNNGSTTLENLYKIATTPRMDEISNVTLLSETVSALYNPAIITQQFGDISQGVKNVIANNPEAPQEVKVNPDLLDVASSGTCVAASIEFNLANKKPAEFARWVEGLSSAQGSITQKVKLSSLSSNLMDAVWLLNAFELRPKEFNFNNVLLEIKPDKNAYVRVKNQAINWDPGERSMVDVLMQSTFMQLGSQQSYDTLTDIRAGNFNSSPQGLIEFEKTFVESVLADKEKFSIVYQDVSPEQKLIGYRTGFDTIERHIKDAINSGEDVIVGYVLTNPLNEIETGHEITIVDYKTDKNGKTVFTCNDTDDDKRELIEYSAEYLIPKIHHAGYSEHVVRNDRHLLDVA